MILFIKKWNGLVCLNLKYGIGLFECLEPPQLFGMLRSYGWLQQNKLDVKVGSHDNVSSPAQVLSAIDKVDEVISLVPSGYLT
jgi:hypothetical protein